MGSDWKIGKLGDHVASCLGKMLDKKKNKGEYYPYLGNSNVRWGYFELDNLLKMKFESHEHERYGIKKGDLIVCEGGEPGRCAIWDCDIPGMKIQKALHRIRPLDGLDSEYLFYWFLNSGKTGRLDPFFTGTTIKHLTGKALAQLPIEIPPIKHQKYCANILRGLDKKIELNRQTNQTLEQMAQTLFKSWFVDFDPVFDNALLKAGVTTQEPHNNTDDQQLLASFSDALRPKAKQRIDVLRSRISTHKGTQEPHCNEGQKLGNEAFPSEFEFNEQLGWIPKGWEVKSLDDTCSEVCRGFTSKYVEKSDLINLNQKVNKGKILEKQYFKYYDNNTKVPQNKYIQKNDILLNSLGQGTLGRVHLYKENSHNVVVDQHITILRAGLASNYVYHYLNHPAGNNRLVNLVTGSTGMLMLNVGKVRNFELPVPSIEVLDLFEKKLTSINGKIFQNTKLSETIIKIRDTLLPKLISGELQIPDVSTVDEKTA